MLAAAQLPLASLAPRCTTSAAVRPTRSIIRSASRPCSPAAARAAALRAASAAQNPADSLTSVQEKAAGRPATLYEKLGGVAGVEAAVEAFYARLLADPELAPFFDGIDMDKQKRKQIQFMSFALGGPNNYGGRDMAAAHRKLIDDMGLTHRHFDGIKRHLGETLASMGVPEHCVAQAAAVVESTRDSFKFPHGR